MLENLLATLIRDVSHRKRVCDFIEIHSPQILYTTTFSEFRIAKLQLIDEILFEITNKNKPSD